LTGGRHSRLPGQGEEFYGHRPYYEGDDLRRVDWHAYQRTGHTYVKEMTRGVEGRLAVVIDASASMCFGEPTRFTLARRIALLLAGAISEDVQIHVTLAGENEVTFAGKRFEELIRFLEEARADKPGLKGSGIVRRFANLLYGKGLVVFIGDFYAEAEEIIGNRKFNPGKAPSSTAVAARLLVPADFGPSEDGELDLRSVEGEGAKVLFWGRGQAEAYRREWERVTKALVEMFSAAGIRMVDFMPGRNLLDIALEVFATGGYISR